MDKRNTGVYEKYIVRRTDNKDAPGCKHESCQYFVLDLTHDKFALPALSAYAEACSLEYPVLSAELIEFVSARQNKGSAEQQPTTGNKSKPSDICPNCMLENYRKKDKNGDYCGACGYYY